jgi:hypothetical protein
MSHSEQGVMSPRAIIGFYSQTVEAIRDGLLG